jgi:hypothetical protein
MPLIFPTSRFGFLDQEVDIERQTLKGGTALSGEQDITSTDGGGRVFAEFGGGSLVDRDVVMAWRALMGELEEGVTRIVVPFCDIRHTPYGGGHSVPHSDGSPFSDKSLYRGGGPIASSAIDLGLRATEAILFAQFGRPLVGGEWFSIDHPTKGPRAYKVRSVVNQTNVAAQVRFIPTLREAVTAGTDFNFADPRCLMTQDGRASTRLQNRRYTEAAIRFIEAP